MFPVSWEMTSRSGGRGPDVGLRPGLGVDGRVDQADEDIDMFTFPGGRVGRCPLRPFTMDVPVGLADILGHVVARGRGQGELPVQRKRVVEGFGRA
jgi:hypothetical protein